MQATSQARKISSIKEKLFVSYLKSERTRIYLPAFFYVKCPYGSNSFFFLPQNGYSILLT